MSDWIVTVKKWAGMCASNAEIKELKSAVKKGEQAMDIAEKTSPFLTKNPKAVQNFSKARKGLGKVSQSLDKMENVCLDIQAAGQIHRAITVLNDDSIIYNDPIKAAEAFGDLFSGFGRLASHLPPPADAYAQLLEAAGKGFFVNMSKKLRPDLRYKGTEYEKYM